jgi:hypothetical protein
LLVLSSIVSICILSLMSVVCWPLSPNLSLK